MLYAVMAAGLVLVFAAVAIDPARDCVDYDCPGWLRWPALGVGAVFAGGAALAMAQKAEWGSRIDIGARQLIWWNGAPPCRVRIVDLTRLAVVRVETRWDSDRLILKDVNGKTLHMPVECAPHPLATWAQTLVALFPHIRVETD